MARVLAVIPARRDSVRLPEKMLADVGGVPLIVRTWYRVTQAGFERVVVATDDDAIASAVSAAGGEVVMTGEAPNGTVRVAEAVERLASKAGVILNVQGDEPLVEVATLQAVAGALSGEAGRGFGVATGCAFLSPEEAERPERVKVVTGPGGRALYFSRARIPAGGPFRVHVGVYAFRSAILRRLAFLPASPLEVSERLEQLRWLESGVRIRVVEVAAPGVSVDTPADLARVRAIVATAGPRLR
jgi:3-deoxy-manno-octulosonate cytidylyltransferase (CMP-KDO synthetase)